MVQDCRPAVVSQSSGVPIRGADTHCQMIDIAERSKFDMVGRLPVELDGIYVRIGVA